MDNGDQSAPHSCRTPRNEWPEEDETRHTWCSTLTALFRRSTPPSCSWAADETDWPRHDPRPRPLARNNTGTGKGTTPDATPNRQAPRKKKAAHIWCLFAPQEQRNFAQTKGGDLETRCRKLIQQF